MGAGALGGRLRARLRLPPAHTIPISRSRRSGVTILATIVGGESIVGAGGGGTDAHCAAIRAHSGAGGWSWSAISGFQFCVGQEEVGPSTTTTTTTQQQQQQEMLITRKVTNNFASSEGRRTPNSRCLPGEIALRTERAPIPPPHRSAP